MDVESFLPNTYRLLTSQGIFVTWGNDAGGSSWGPLVTIETNISGPEYVNHFWNPKQLAITSVSENGAVFPALVFPSPVSIMFCLQQFSGYFVRFRRIAFVLFCCAR